MKNGTPTAAQIRAARRRKKQTQIEAAREIGISRVSFYMLETGRTRPTKLRTLAGLRRWIAKGDA